MKPRDVGDTGAGHAATHPKRVALRVLAAPSTGDEFNAIRPMLATVGCVRLDDPRFDFDSSFLVAESRAEFHALKLLLDDQPDSPLAVFGHADPTGDDAYNKTLSGRRARAVYAVIVRDLDAWEELYSQPFGGDHWGPRQVQAMLAAIPSTDGTPYYAGAVKTSYDTAARNSIKHFQGDNGLADDGDPGPATRRKLFEKYMDALCTDDDGAVFRRERKDFLAQGEGGGGKGDYQGCSEFNPVRVFSTTETAAFNQPANKGARDDSNGINRRAVIYLFEPGSRVTPSQWPCPRVTEGVADCKKRFWSDGEVRRNPQAARREYGKTRDTFACRFYQRLALASPCEAPGVLCLELLYEDGSPMADADFEAVFEASSITGRTDARGRAVVDAPEGAGPVFKLFLRAFPERFVDPPAPSTAGAPAASLADGGDAGEGGAKRLWPHGVVA
jgi:hypothetical protein